MKALDLFSGGGGGGFGYKLAGYEVTGIDLEDHSRFYTHVGEFHQMDWREGLEKYGGDADFIHASPPCQDYSKAMRHLSAPGYPRLIGEVREALTATGKPWIIENVYGSPLPNADTLFGDHGIELCGTMFGLRIWRHRLFQASFPVAPPRGCDHTCLPVNPHNVAGRKRIYAEHGRGENPEKIWAREMGVSWITDDHVAREVVPPAYTRYLGTCLADLLASPA
jgi:DNA (cytosine-5)-methyltransferase 1